MLRRETRRPSQSAIATRAPGHSGQPRSQRDAPIPWFSVEHVASLPCSRSSVARLGPGAKPRRSTLRFFNILLVALTAGGLACAPKTPGPNVILIVLDTVRKDRLGCYGNTRETSPTLDDFARGATLYEKATSASPWTLPSHASIFTGLPPSRHGTHHEHPYLAESQTTIAERLTAVGYQTAGFSNNPWITEKTGLNQGVEHYVETWRSLVSRGTFALNVFVDPAKYGIDDAGAALTLQAIRRWFDGRDESDPFFLFVNLIEAHFFYSPPEGYRNRFLETPLTRQEARRANDTFVQDAYGDSLKPGDIPPVLALYDGEIAYLDSWFKEFRRLLAERQLDERTMLVVVSDHGEAFAEHELYRRPLIDHQLSLYDELLAVPLIIRYPAEDPARVSTPVSTLDLVPTILDVAGLGIPAELPGESLRGEPPKEERLLFSEYYRPVLHLGMLRRFVQNRGLIQRMTDRRLVAVRSGARKLILSSAREQALFDLAADPGEQSPLGPDPHRSALVKEAKGRLARMAETPDLTPAELGPAEREALRSLGYLE